MDNDDILPDQKKRGNPRWSETLTHQVQKKGAQSNRLKSINNPSNKQALNVANELRLKGFTLQDIAEQLNKTGHRTPKGYLWIPSSVGRILNR